MAMNAAKKRAQLALAWLILLAYLATAAARALYGCNHTCGKVSVPYPFGIGTSSKTGENCFLDESFKLTCDHSKLLLGSIQVSYISLPGQLEMSLYISKVCYDKGGKKEGDNRPCLTTPYFPISSKQNKFITVGCDSYGYLNSFRKGEKYSTGCLTRCDSKPNTEILKNKGTCSGIGCCQVDIPPGMKNITTEAFSFYNLTHVMDFNNCSYAFVAKTGWYKFDEAHFGNLPLEKAPVVFDWYVGNETCESARKSPKYACRNNSRCLDADNRDGYHCSCESGYEGNPYHPDGCRDIDECNSKTSRHNCTSDEYCLNIEGSFGCIGQPYPLNGKKPEKGPEGCSKVEIIVISVLCSSAGSLILAGGSLWLYQVYQPNIGIRLRLKCPIARRNDRSKLNQKPSTTKDSSPKVEIFTEKELKKATNNYSKSSIVGKGSSGDVFRGTLENHNNKIVAIKKSKVVDEHQIDEFVEGVVELSQVTHEHLVELVGYCLETKVPLLVYEFVPNGNLYDYMHKKRNASNFCFRTRLMIASEAAEALSYLHSKHIIHGGFQTKNILLTKNYTVKVSDYGALMLFPSDQTELATLVKGSLGYLDPEYLLTYQLTEKSDVYSFGVVLVELLSGKKVISLEKLDKGRSLVKQFVSWLTIDNLDEVFEMIMPDEDEGKLVEDKGKLKEVFILAEKCLRLEGEKRPSMQDVAENLKEITKTYERPSNDINAEVMQTNENLGTEISEILEQGDCNCGGTLSNNCLSGISCTGCLDR